MKTNETIEVKRVYVDGIVEKLEHLPDEWHKKYGRDGKKYYKLTTRFENPINPNDSLIFEEWPLNDGVLEDFRQGNEVKKHPFEIFGGEVYTIYTVPSGHDTEVGLRGVSKNAEPLIKVRDIKVIYKGKEIGWSYNPFYDSKGKYVGGKNLEDFGR